uniref:PDZ domain-containing protein n=1 Tax=Laticauda laticaudata TaxID=8630 RepID=A0A8C5SD45_LATLA
MGFYHSGVSLSLVVSAPISPHPAPLLMSIGRIFLTPGGKAAQAGVGVGDWVLSIDGDSTSTMTHIEAQNKIRACGDKLSLSLNGISRKMGWGIFPGSLLLLVLAACKESSRSLSFSPPNSARNESCKASLPWSVCRHSLRLVSLPAFFPSDTSKKRLIEDTEDWRPRTGTTQSPSFRILAHLTGTEFSKCPFGGNCAREKFVLDLRSPRYTHLRDWHHQRSATSLNVLS